MSLIAFEKHFFVVDEKVTCTLANGHTSSNIPDPIRTRKSSDERPGQYWGGGPPGKPLGCCWLFTFFVFGAPKNFRGSESDGSDSDPLFFAYESLQNFIKP